MAHFAKVDSSNIVTQVVVVNNDVLKDSDGNESEQIGIDFLFNLFGGWWKQTSYNTFHGEHKFGGTPFRGNYAGIGHTYNPDLDAFIPIQPYPSWSLDESSYKWMPPSQPPDDGSRYAWNEAAQLWVAPE
jgi:hypothetical protein